MLYISIFMVYLYLFSLQYLLWPHMLREGRCCSAHAQPTHTHTHRGEGPVTDVVQKSCRSVHSISVAVKWNGYFLHWCSYILACKHQLKLLSIPHILCAQCTSHNPHTAHHFGAHIFERVRASNIEWPTDRTQYYAVDIVNKKRKTK